MYRPICIPSTPPGVTLFSLVVAIHSLSGNPSKKVTLQHLFGRPDAHIVGCFSACFAQSKGSLGKDIALLKQSGVFGLYASTMSSRRAMVWLTVLQRSTSSRSPNPQQFATGMSRQPLMKRVMHCCPTCIREDERKFGIAFWHTVHQLPGVLHCPVHHVALHGACLDCGCAQASEHIWHLPAATCPHCGGGRFSRVDVVASPGYLRHLSFVGRAVLGDYELLRPNVRARLYAEAFRVGQEGDVKQVVAALLDMWRCSNLSELSSALGTRITWRFIDAAIHGDGDGVNPLCQLALISLAQSLMSARGGDFDSLNSDIPVCRPAAGLEAALEASGLPSKIAAQLAEGYSLTRLSGEVGVPYPRLRRQLVHVFGHDIEKLYDACSDDPRSAEAVANLRALAEKLRQPRRQSNTFHSRRGVTDLEELRNLNRARVQRYIAQGVRTRKQLHYKNSDLGDWCRSNDSAWFDAVLPAIPQALRKGVGRRKIKRAH